MLNTLYYAGWEGHICTQQHINIHIHSFLNTYKDCACNQVINNNHTTQQVSKDQDIGKSSMARNL